jgi:hypothetical protein
MNWEWPITTSTRRGDTTWALVNDRWRSFGVYADRIMDESDLCDVNLNPSTPHRPEQVAALYEAIIAQQVEVE